MKENLISKIIQSMALWVMARTAYSVYTKLDGSEKLKYKILQKNENYELREYNPYIIAQVTIPNAWDVSWDAFRILWWYIFGNNKSKKNISMTSPVITKSEKLGMVSPVLTKTDNDIYTMSFVMPSDCDIDGLPIPNDNRITFQKIESYKSAVYWFSWYTNDQKVKKITQRLKYSLDNDNIKYFDEAILMRYDPPFIVPFLIQNEILLKIK